MDPSKLVSRERVERAGLLFLRLRADGLETQGALWTQAEGDGQPYLYVITPNVENEGLIQANLRLGRTLREFQQGVTDPYSLLDPYEIKLIRPSDPLAQGLEELYQRFPADRPIVHTGALGGVPIEGAYIYPAKMFAPPTAQPQSA